MDGLINASELRANSHSLLSLKSLICRTCLYPLSCFLAYIGTNVSIIYYYISNTDPIFILYWGRFGYCSRGILHLFSFLADPMVARAILVLFRSKDEPNQQGLRSNQVVFSSECEFTYDFLVGPSGKTSSPGLYKMVQDLQRYI
ncbi:hypothetical protein DSO57_1034115 [Entomophthora muscae]|uniref:Uncharacterized protein n=1 Tax=Entomophthora muscae TaxID=34485 RepID=A0ACC2S220_9FUNG|nr:hypothetical protein DSO57_1034115 [Entomophthora muscae]